MKEQLSTVFTVVVVVLALLSAILDVGGTVLLGREAASSPGDPGRRGDPLDWREMVARQRIQGPEEPLVKITVFVDYQSSLSRRLRPRLRKIRARYPQRVAVAYRHFPLEEHLRAFPAAIASECAARQGRFAAYHALLLEHQGRLWGHALVRLARQAGVPDMEAFQQCVSERRAAEQVEGDRRAAQEVGIIGVPALVIDRTIVMGLRPVAVLDSLVRAALP